MAKCFGKVPHKTRRQAKRHRRLLAGANKESKGEISVYWCEQCLAFHIGHHRKGRGNYAKG